MIHACILAALLAYLPASNETQGEATIKGKTYVCVTTDFGGRLETVCAPKEK